MILPDLALVDNFSSSMTAVGETTAYYIQNDYRIVAYTDENLNATVAIKHDTESEWQRAIVGSNINDAHNSISVGVDSDGYIHTVHDIHNALSFSGHYNISSQPYDVSEMVESEIQGAAVASVSYARFYRAGDILYLLFRVGSSGSGDEWLKRYDTTTRTWFDALSTPLIAGSTLDPPDNPYMGSCVGDESGNLHLIWTHRVGFYNERIYYAKYEGSTGLVRDVAGTVLSLPLSRNSPIQSITPPTDRTIGNNGIGLVLDLSTGLPLVVFNSREKSGYPEVFFSRYNPTTSKWESIQLSNLSLPRLRACPGGPQEPDSPPRPCDFELQGPFIVCDTSTLYVFYARSIGTTNPAWQRPAALLYLSTSTDNGLTWSTTEIKRPTDKLFGEVIRESNGKPSVLLQELTFENGPLWILDLDELSESLPPSNPVIDDVSASLTGDNHISLNGPSTVLDSFTISAWIRPNHIEQRMGIIDKGGLAGNREYRLLLWGVTDPFRYDASRVQILIGSSTGGWGLVRNVETEVLPGYRTHLVVVYDREAGTVILYKNGVFIDAVEYSSDLVQGQSNTVIGANLDANGIAENFFHGSLKVKLYNHTLTPNQVVYLYHQSD